MEGHEKLSKKIVPFPFVFVPEDTRDIKNGTIIVATLHLGKIIVDADNPRLLTDFKNNRPVSVINADGSTDNKFVIDKAIFDPRTNDIAVYINGSLHILDYDKINGG